MLKYLAALLLFGSNGVVASHIALSSVEIVLTRTLAGSLFLGLMFLLTRQRPQVHNKRHLLYLAVAGVAMGANWMFLYEAYAEVGVSIATLACYCGPVIVMLLAPFVFREPLTAPKLLGFVSVLGGMAFVNLQALAEGKTAWGLFCGLMAAVTYAVMLICNKKAASITGLENAMWQLVGGCITVAVFVGLRQGFALDMAPASLLPILFLGIVNTGVGCWFYFSALGRLPVQTAAICGYLEPLAALLFSAAFLSETLGPVQIAGAVLILGGAAFGEFMGHRSPSIRLARMAPRTAVGLYLVKTVRFLALPLLGMRRARTGGTHHT